MVEMAGPALVVVKARLARALRVLAAVGALLALGAPGALAQDASAPQLVNAEALLKALLGLFVAATVLEFALTVLFQWRVYREFLNGKAVKSLVAVAAGYLVVTGFDYDIFARIMGLAGGTGEGSALSLVLSAFILAGGSAGVNELMRKLGLRPPNVLLEDRPKPAESKAWGSLRVVARRAVGPVLVQFDKVESPTQDEMALPALAGVIGARTCWLRFTSLFLGDNRRFPPSGGKTVDAGPVYRIAVSGRLRTDDPDRPLEEFQYEVFRGRFAERAIIDLSCEI
ncbi:hypothetical protein RNZ50_04845 [Paracoccaceae bacterium Fryx2]|nr:hypothetical protein [Paracoccaceae bacterium Fryx2]